MRSLTLLAALVVCALFTSAAYAADGDRIACTGQGLRGWETLCYMVCDSKTSASTTCSSYTLREPADTITFEIAEDDDCSAAAEIDITHASSTTTDAHELTELVRGGDTAVTLTGAAAQPLPVLAFALSNMTDCTDFDVKMILRWERRN
jgi:hypothetical protein